MLGWWWGETLETNLTLLKGREGCSWCREELGVCTLTQNLPTEPPEGKDSSYCDLCIDMKDREAETQKGTFHLLVHLPPMPPGD